MKSLMITKVSIYLKKKKAYTIATTFTAITTSPYMMFMKTFSMEEIKDATIMVDLMIYWPMAEESKQLSPMINWIQKLGRTVASIK